MVKFEAVKAKNCFSDAQTWEYHLSSSNETLLSGFGTLGEVVCKTNLRRPIFMLNMKDGTRVKGVLKSSLVRASFPAETWEAHKSVFEQALSNLEADDATGI